jgi:hypothetical protein
MLALFDDALTAERVMWRTCGQCGNKQVRVDVPDWNARLKVVELMLEQGFGKPAPTDPRTLTDERVGQILADIGSASDDDLAGIVAQVEAA